MMNQKQQRIVVTGGSGFLGSYVVEELIKRNYDNLFMPESKDFDLRKFNNCEQVVENANTVIHLAARAGGIGLNCDFPGTLFYDNITMGVNMIEASRLAGVKKFVCIGTVCAYPKFTSVPFNEDQLWCGYPEETNAPYGIAKKVLLVMLQAYSQQYNFQGIYLLPVNLYGPRDNFDLSRSHVIPALIRKVYEAKCASQECVVVWGTGAPTREFLYVEDAARGIVGAFEHYDDTSPVNLGSGMEISISDLVTTICALIDYKGKIIFDSSKPDGQPRRCLDTSRAETLFGFKSTTSFAAGLRKTIDWYIANAKHI